MTGPVYSPVYTVMSCQLCGRPVRAATPWDAALLATACYECWSSPNPVRDADSGSWQQLRMGLPDTDAATAKEGER